MGLCLRMKLAWRLKTFFWKWIWNRAKSQMASVELLRKNKSFGDKTSSFSLISLHNKPNNAYEIWKKVRWKASVVILWSRLLSRPSSRRASEILLWDLSVKGECASEMFELLWKSDGETGGVQTKCPSSQWAEEIWRKPKLRTYRLFEKDYRCEKYVQYN